MKIVKCPMCHGDGEFDHTVIYKGLGGSWYERCGLYCSTGSVSQELRMEWVRSFKKCH